MGTNSPQVVEFVLSRISDGFLFEQFGKEFLGASRGTEFEPIGGIKDRGIDGLERTYTPNGKENHIYQLSIEKNTKTKIIKTVETLHNNRISFARLIFVTNHKVKDKEQIEDDIFENHNAIVQIWDLDWFTIQVNSNSATLRVFDKFRSANLHEYEQPGKAYEVVDLARDPRVYVFLSQQWDASQQKSKLDEFLADTLILFSLEGTDPDKNILRGRDEIIKRITSILKSDPQWLYPTIDRRLKELSSKPLRKTKHHTKADGYCLPYITRLEIQQRNIEDKALYDKFVETTKNQLGVALNELKVVVHQPYALLESVLHRLFKQQGLEFANFVETRDGALSVEKSLQDLVSSVVNESSVIPQNREQVKVAVLTTIRNIIYEGTDEQVKFLRRLANTYNMFFLLQCDPKLATYFSTMAAQLRVYVDTSILIPALSEYFLEKRHRRYWNLLVSSNNAGVSLIVNDLIISELASHFRLLKQQFHEKYENQEDLYIDEVAIMYVNEILIRAYFYSKRNGHVSDFESFIETFVSRDMVHINDELIQWLSEAFGTEYEERRKLGIHIDSNEENELYEELSKYKASSEQARNDARQLLTIYGVRELNDERGSTGIYGYKTWWLTTDTISQKSLENIAGRQREFRTSPYIRADFLYNYVTLAPTPLHVDEIFKEMFPTLLGVNISFHIPQDIRTAVQKYMKDYEKLLGAPRLKGILRNLGQRLKTDNTFTREKVQLWLDEQQADFKKKRSPESKRVMRKLDKK
ncbi:MAG: hypothetical protein KF716_30045 [Anaerolineae bacterium]|nr:hypothetical protein [Anaerolineae bacterium]